MPQTDPFATLARRRFAFLESDHSFAFRVIDSGYVRFEQPELELNLCWSRWEYSAILQVRREDAVFRPYVSRQFALHTVVLAFDPAAYPSSGELPLDVKTLEDVDRYLLLDAALLRKHCVPVLDGDFAVLEAMYKGRETSDR